MACTAMLIAVSPSAFAQRQLGKKKGPTSKLYVAEALGDAQIQTGDRIYTVRQASAFDAPGTVIVTKENSRTAFVYSNGVGMTIGENSRVEIIRFEQAPFSASGAASANTDSEPSSSQSDIFLSRGTVGISTSQLASGSSMSCSTELGSINIRGGNVSIQSNATETIVDLLDGSATVLSSDKDGSSYVMKPGERIILRRTAVGLPLVIFISLIPPQALPELNVLVSVASNARKTVTFEVIEKKATLGLDAPPPAAVTTTGGDKKPATTADTASGATTADAAGGSSGSNDSTQEIVAKPTVPAQLPINVVVSPDRLPGT